MSRGTPIGNMVIKVDLDKTGFEKSMTGLNRQLKSVNKEMRANLSQFSRSDRSIGKFETRIEGLSKKYAIQEKAVESARKEHEKLLETHDANSTAVQSSAQDMNEAIAKYNETGRALSDLKNDFANFKKEQEIMNSGWTKTGNAMQSFGQKMKDVSTKATDIGMSLTKKITLPALGVATAVGGMFAKLGWDRLVSLDTAQAKLKGLGYSTEDVGRISKQVTNAIEGGMTTMAEGTMVATGAMAAGVKEGADLEKYIKLVGDAAVGAGRPVEDMAQIFNRVQGGGKLMTQELNQIEHAMPGFSQSMAKHLNVTHDEFRKMVTEGEVSSKDFLVVMDDFAGGMAEEYAKSWQGMVANTKAYIGILGESLMSGVFEESKESIAQFIELLKSPEAQEYAEKLGKKLSGAFAKIIDKVKAVVKWYSELSSRQKDLINKLAIFLVAIGPILVGLGALGNIVGSVIKGLGVFATGIGKVGGVFGGLSKILGSVGGVATKVGGVFTKFVGVLKPLITVLMTIGKVILGALLTPIGLITVAVTAVIATFVLLYKHSETFRNGVHAIGNAIKDIVLSMWETVKNVGKWIGDVFKNLIKSIKDFLKPVIDAVVGFKNDMKDKLFGWWNEEGDKILKAFDNIRDGISKFLGFFVDVFNNMKKEFGIAVDWTSDKLDDLKNAFGVVIKWIGNKLKELKDVFSSVFNWIMDFLSPFFDWFKNIWDKSLEFVSGLVKKGFDIVKNIISNVMNFIGKHIKQTWNAITDVISLAIDIILEVINIFASVFTKDWKGVWESVKNITSKVVEIIWVLIKNSFVGRIIKAIVGFTKDFFDKIKEMWSNAKNTFTSFIKSIYEYVKNSFIGRIISSIVSFVKNFKTHISNLWNSVKNTFTSFIKGIYEYVKNSFIGKIITAIVGFVKNFKTNITNLWNNIKNTFTSFIKNIYNNFKNSFVGKIISSILSFVKNFKTHINNLWNNIKNTFANFIKNIYNNFKNSFVGRIVSAIIGFVKNFKSNISSMWNSIKNTFTKFITSIRNSIANSFVGSMLTSVRSLKTNFVNIAKDMWSGVKKQFTNIVDGAKALPGRIGKGIRGARDKAINGMKSVGRGVMSAAGKPINATIDGVNWILGKVKAPKIKGKWKIPQYAKGTSASGHKGGNAIVGDGGGRELIKLPNGESFLSPDTDTMMNLPKGTHVVPHRETEMMLKADVPHYAKGTKGWKDKLSNIWSFIKKPFTAVKNMMDGIKIRKKEKGMARSVATGSLNYLKDKPKQFIKDIFKKKEKSEDNPEYVGSGGGKPAFGWRMSSPYGYRTHPISGARRLHGGVDYAAPSGTPIPSTTDGRVSSVIRGWGGGFGNHVRVKSGIMEMLYAHMSSIAVRQGQKVKKGTMLGRVGSTGASTGPHLHYETRRKGVRVNPLSIKGHKTGGLIESQMLSMLGEDGQEMVIPLNQNRRSDAMKLLALTGKMLGVDEGKSKRPHQLPSVRGSSNSSQRDEHNEQLNDLLTATLEQNNILMQLLQKDTTIVMNEKEVGRSVADTVTKRQSSKADYRLAKKGIREATI